MYGTIRNVGVGVLVLMSSAVWAAPNGAEDRLGEAINAESAESTLYLYLMCNATGWQPNDSTYVPIDWHYGGDGTLVYNVNEPWMVSNHDDCALVWTNELNGWGTVQHWQKILTEDENGNWGTDVVVGTTKAAAYSNGTSTNTSPFTVKYPTLGRYTFSYKATYPANFGFYQDDPARISYWQGKVNTHRDSGGTWTYDSDCTSGAEIDPLTYCQKFYPTTTSVTAVAVSTKPALLWNTAGCNQQYSGDGHQEWTCNP